jgi:hypothetical protein
MAEVITRKRTRRDFIMTGAAGIGLLLAGTERLALAAEKKESKEEEISPVEDLMREHGVLRRVLLIYEESLRRLDTGKDLPSGGGRGITLSGISRYQQLMVGRPSLAAMTGGHGDPLHLCGPQRKYYSAFLLLLLVSISNWICK